MADFRILARHYPSVRAYIRLRRWINRSGVLAYAPGIEGGAFNTDAYGFRRGHLNGAAYDLEAAFSGQPYALVLGSSHVFGFGLDSDADTIPSQLAARCGLPCLNLSFPEAQLHALYAVALRVCRQAPRPPVFIALLPGGMLTRFAYVRMCDPLFGVPDFQQPASPDSDPTSANEQVGFASLLAYSSFWMDQIAMLASTHECKFVIHPEYTAFEKNTLSAIEDACSLTRAVSAADQARFATHRLRYRAYTDAIIRAVPRSANVARCDPAALTYLDEFHYTAAGTALIADALAAALD